MEVLLDMGVESVGIEALGVEALGIEALRAEVGEEALLEGIGEIAAVDVEMSSAIGVELVVEALGAEELEVDDVVKESSDIGVEVVV